MATLVSDLISQALLEIGDPNGDRFKREQMLQLFNRIQLKLSTEYKCLEKDEYFNLIAGEPRYTYPTGAVQMRKLRLARVNPPTGLQDYYWADEVFSEEFEATTSWGRPSSTLSGYFARPGWFELDSVPPEDVPRGGLFTGWFRTTRLTSEVGAEMELRESLENTVQEGMQILARMAGRERAAALGDYKLWQDSLAELRPMIEDMSDDRRSSLRTPRQGNPTGGMR